MISLPSHSKRTASLFPYTTLFRSRQRVEHDEHPDEADDHCAPPLPPRRLAEQQRGENDGKDRHRHADRRRLRHRQQDHRAEIARSEEHTSELQSLMRISYAAFCLKKKRILKHSYNMQNHYQV